MRTLQSEGAGVGPPELAPWFHNLHLPDGRETAPDHPLGDFPAWKWRELAPYLPDDMRGMRALDIGCNAGFYSFELARRGAAVLAVDLDERYLRQAEWARAELSLERQVELRRMSVYDLAHLPVATRFDVVLFLGVFYHLRHPLLALDIVAERTAGMLVFQTLTRPGGERLDTPDDLPIHERDQMLQAGWPAMSFIERELAGDATNWWAPDAACVEAMLRSTGMRVTAAPAHEFWICEPAPGADLSAVRAELDAVAGRRP